MFINIINKENTCPTFKHPENWPQMSDLEKGHLLVKLIFLKLLAVVDFCDFEFKEARIFNVDSKSPCNKPKPPSRNIEKVREEIMSTRQRFDIYKNHLPNDIPSNDNLFKFLGLMTDRQSDNLHLKGKPLKQNVRGLLIL